MMPFAGAVFVSMACAAVSAREPAPRTLSFEDRVRAQEAIERVYYRHQAGATKPFAAAVPRAVLEGKVLRYLNQTDALRSVWNTEVTGAALTRELARINKGSRMPERLSELYEALGYDAFVVKECLVRATLVDRLTRSFENPRGSDASPRVDRTATVSACAIDGWDNGQLDEGPGTPTPRSNHVAVWTGTHMLVWGGEDGPYYGTGPLGTGGRYDPALDAWTPITTLNAPSPRTGHSAIWTGDSMIVWGGGRYDADFGGDISFDTGGRYDPLTDTWSPTTTAGAPVAREEHTAVWTGSRMVVWGGSNGSYNPLSTGGRYDPVTDSWAPTSIAGAPFFRQRHTAVWTGSSMVIWGGLYGGVEGGRYDPATDTWLPTSTVGVPAERWWHEAIWTGSRMLIWGGEVDGAPPSQGASYDPVGNTWQPIPQTGQPQTIARGSAIWTGSEMVVWGGVVDDPMWDGLSGFPPPSGGRYDPATGVWRDTTMTGAPAGRARHTAVWTGSRMLVWGGDTYHNAKLATGGSWLADGPATDDCDGDQYTVAEGDCNDDDPGVFPGAAETCDGVDDDCDGTIDNGGDALCDDGNPCFADACQGGCIHTPVPEGTSCDDNNTCNGHDECDGYGFCYSSDPPYCSLFNPCLIEWCDPIMGCMYEQRPVGAPCPDNDACNGDESCDEWGLCAPGTPMPAPPEVTGLTAASDKITYSWPAAPTAAHYNVVRGTTANLPVGRGAGDEACLNTLTGASMTDSSVPPVGLAYWYLSRGVNECAGAGSWGNRSNGVPRTTTTCP